MGLHVGGVRWAAVEIGALAAALALAVAPAAAAAIDVTTTGDPGPVGTVSIRQAIAVAASGSTIAVPAGTYVLAGGQLTIDKSLTIAGAGASATTVSGGSASRVFSLQAAGAVELSGLTVTGGRVLAPTAVENGGGVRADAGSPLTLRGVRVTGNEIDVSGTSGVGGVAEGGGIFTKSSLTLIGTTVAGNTLRALGAPGKSGGIVKGAGIADEGTLEAVVSLTDSAVDAATADASGGAGASGGIAQGGGIYIAEGPLTLVRAAVTRSSVLARATGLGAGGIAEGGGIITGGSLALTNATVSSNTGDASAEGTGGIAAGGGIYPTTDMTLVSSTVTANRALSPGTKPGITGSGNVETGGATETVTSSIISAGVGGAGKENCSGPLTSGGHNLESTDQCGFHAAGDLVAKDPLLGPLQDNGGPSLTHAPAAASPAIDTGDIATCPPTDQRGIARPQGPHCDIGSFERAVEIPVIAPPPAAPATHTTPLPALPAAFGSKGIITGAPSNKACLSRRAFTIRIRKLAGITVTSAKVLVNAKQIAVRSGKRLTAPINLRKLPKGRYTVQIIVKTSDGRTISGTRTYRTCTRKRHSTGPKL